MDLVISQLNLKFSEFRDAIKEKRALRSYKAIYEYFDIIRVQKNALEIIEQDRREIEAKKATVKSNKELGEKEKKKITSRIEDYSPSFCYDTINDKVYSPIKTYRESVAPSPEESLIGLALTRQESDKRVIEVITELFANAVTMNIEELKIFWTRLRYRFNLEKASSWLETLHTGLVKKMLELPVIEFKEGKADDRIKIVIDDNRGIYQEGKEQLAYSVARISKRMKLIKHLAVKDICSLAELNRITKQDKVVTMKSIPEINELFRSKLNLNDDLILSIDTGGYSINKDIYAVTIKR